MLSACDGGQGDKQNTPEVRENTRSAIEPHPRPEPSDPNSAAAQTHAPAPSTQRSKPRIVSTSAGSAYRVPSAPRSTQTAPDKSCARAKAVPGKAGESLSLPPAPGLSARRRGREAVAVSFVFRSVGNECRPARLKVTIDVSQDVLPGAATYVRVRGLKGTTTIPTPADLRAADVVRATAYTKDLRGSRSAAVQIK
jgi:hypothetical protein